MGLFKKIINSINQPNSNNTYPIFANKEQYDNYSPWGNNNDNSEYSNALFLEWVKNKPSILQNNDDYPRYMATDLGIKNPKAKHQQLISEGYLYYDYISAINNLKVEQLKEILLQFNLPTQGKKAELIERIINNIQPNQLKITPILSLSDKGKSLISQYSDLIRLHKERNLQISVSEFNNNYKGNYVDTVLYILDKRLRNDIKQHNYGVACTEWMEKRKIYKKEELIENELLCYLTVLAYSISGSSNYADLEFEYFEDIKELFLPPLSSKDITKFKPYLTENIIQAGYNNAQVPFKYFDLKTFFNIVEDMFENKEIDLSKYKHKTNPKPLPKTQKDWDEWMDDYVEKHK